MERRTTERNAVTIEDASTRFGKDGFSARVGAAKMPPWAFIVVVLAFVFAFVFYTWHH